MRHMDDSEPPVRGAARAAVRMGRTARRVLTAGRGSVLAAFASTLYLESEAGVACIAPPPTPCGPLNAVMPGFVLPAAADLDRATWRTDEATLAVGGLGTFMLSPRVDWTPPRPPAVDAATLRAGLASMRAALVALPPRGEVLPHVLGALPGRAPGGDLPGRVFPCPPGGTAARDEACGAPLPAPAPGRPPGRGGDGGCAGEARFARSVLALERWIGHASCGKGPPPDPPAADLLGAGRGLTPSGDDFLAGALVALHAFGERAVAASLACAVARCAPCRTSRLSAAHLEAACAGEAIEPLHEAVGAVAGNAYPGRALDALERFGHGSGFDALAGVLLVARAIACPAGPERTGRRRRTPPAGTTAALHPVFTRDARSEKRYGHPGIRRAQASYGRRSR